MSLSIHRLTPRYAALWSAFQARYLKAVVHKPEDVPQAEALLASFLEHAIAQVECPYAFAPLHHALRAPFDYYAFGLEFFRSLIDLPRSRFLGVEHLKTIEEIRQAGSNVIFLANHQVEADPQVLSIFFEQHAKALAEELFCVAGARVTSDPLAVPFTLGRNILSVHSKNHMDSDPEIRAGQQAHNLRTLSALSKLLGAGGQAIYVAPSGGRDRLDDTGQLNPAPFDPQNVQLFRLLAQKARKPVHFYPMALSTYPILPPPGSRQSELGEERHVAKSPVGIAIGHRLIFDTFDKDAGKETQQHAATDHAWQSVLALYKTLQKQLSLDT